MEVPAYYLFLPPTPLKSRFVLLEESTKTFYDVDVGLPKLKNPASWATEGLSPELLGNRVAILIFNRLNEHWKSLLVKQGIRSNFERPLNPDFEVGGLVSIQRQEGNIVYAKVLGKVTICPFDTSLVSFENIGKMKGAVLADEMRNGLLGKVYGKIGQDKPFVHPDVLQKMPRKWHIDAEALNYELDGIFAAGLTADKGSVKWVLSEEHGPGGEDQDIEDIEV